MTAIRCPDTHALKELIEYDSPGGSGEFAEHLETCAVCQQTLADLAAEEVPWADVKRYLPASGTPEDAPIAEAQALQGAIHQLKSELPRLLQTSGDVGEEELPLSFLRPADRPGLLGYLGPYEVQELIGRGGMGVVFKAWDPTLRRLVAIKVMAAVNLVGSATARRRFAREAQAAAAVTHDHIVTVYGVHEADGLPYLVMQFVAGESLEARLQRTGPLSVLDTVRIGWQTASGLAAAHAQGLIHRDIKPANLLLEDDSDRVRITDFGLARMADDVQLTQKGVILGTPEYMSPEQARGEPVDPRTDLFSLGSVLYAAATGLPPFQGTSAVAVLRQVSDQPARPIRAHNPALPPWLEEVIARLMAKDPDRRLQTAADVAKIFKDYHIYLEGPADSPAPQLPVAPQTPPQAKTTRSSSRPRRAYLLLVLAVAAAGLAFTSWFAGCGGGTGEEKPFKESAETLPTVFHSDFRHGAGPAGVPLPLPPELVPVNLERREHIQLFSDALVYKVQRPFIVGPGRAVGVETTFGLRGDFDISATFDGFKAERPEHGTGVGFGLCLVSTERKLVWVSRATRIADEGVIWDRFGSGQTGLLACTEDKGRLRLNRTGSKIAYLWSPDTDGGEYKLLDECELGTNDISSVRMHVFTGGQAKEVDLRLLDFRVLGQKESNPQHDPAKAAKPSANADLPKGRLSLAVLLGIVIMLLAGLALWLFVRRRAAKEPVVQ
jgi:serine/threonine protein kinase